MPTLYDEKCQICHGSGYVIKDMTMYDYYGCRAEAEIKQLCDGIRDPEERTKREDMLRDNWKNFVLQPTAFRCPKCNSDKRVITQRKQAAHLPEIMQEATMLDFKWDVYLDDNGKPIDTGKKQQLVQLFLSQFASWRKHGTGLYISSKMRGSGKTFLASAICNALMVDKYVKVQFVSASDLIPIDAGEYVHDNVTIDSLINCDVVVIDDLGQKNNGKGWTEDILYNLLNERMVRKNVTIITSNHTIGELEYDSRIVDRINQMTVPLSLPEVSVRLSKADDDKRELFREIGFMKGVTA